MGVAKEARRKTRYPSGVSPQPRSRGAGRYASGGARRRWRDRGFALGHRTPGIAPRSGYPVLGTSGARRLPPCPDKASDPLFPGLSPSPCPPNRAVGLSTTPRVVQARSAEKGRGTRACQAVSPRVRWSSPGARAPCLGRGKGPGRPGCVYSLRGGTLPVPRLRTLTTRPSRGGASVRITRPCAVVWCPPLVRAISLFEGGAVREVSLQGVPSRIGGWEVLRSAGRCRGESYSVVCLKTLPLFFIYFSLFYFFSFLFFCGWRRSLLLVNGQREIHPGMRAGIQLKGPALPG